MASQYLNKTGLTYLWGRITALFQPKEAGKGLSTNDLTNELKAEIEKVSTIETQLEGLVTTGGEPNVIETVKVNGTALTPDANKAVDVDVLRVAFVETGAGTDDATITSASFYDGQYATKHVSFFMTSDGVRFSAADDELQTQGDAGVTVNRTLPDETRVNALIAAALAEGIGGVTQFRYLPVDALPATGEAGVIYLVPNSGSAPNIKDEYIWINNGTTENPDYAFEKIGTTEVNLTNYLQSSDIEAITTAEIDEITGA